MTNNLSWLEDILLSYFPLIGAAMSAFLCTIPLTIKTSRQSRESDSMQPTAGALYSFTVSLTAAVFTMVLTLIRLDESGIVLKPVMAVALLFLACAIGLTIKIGEIRRSWLQCLSLLGVILLCFTFAYWSVNSTLPDDQSQPINQSSK